MLKRKIFSARQGVSVEKDSAVLSGSVTVSRSFSRKTEVLTRESGEGLKLIQNNISAESKESAHAAW